MTKYDTLTEYNRTAAVMEAAPEMHLALLKVAQILQGASGDMRKPTVSELNRMFEEVHGALKLAHGKD